LQKAIREFIFFKNKNAFLFVDSARLRRIQSTLKQYVKDWICCQKTVCGVGVNMGDDNLKAGDVKIFLKSGNPVRLIEPDGKGWVVERTTGSSKGKQMWCPSRSLVDKSALE
jgi:hypothetical protein